MDFFGFWMILIMVVGEGHHSRGANTNVSETGRPKVLLIGSILTEGSLVGKVAMAAIEAAVEDVNSSPAILPGTDLKITTFDSNFSGFMGIVEVIRFMETETVAIIGPQSSVIAHVISHIANELQTPMLSYAATDPALSSLQYPFFVRTSPNDLFQMAAIAELVEYYEWREVIAIYVDDDFGRNGITALADQLALKRGQISYKAALTPDGTKEEIRDVLVQVSLMESRIFVVHTYPAKGLEVFSVAQNLGMMESGFVWFATNWLTTKLDSDGLSSPKVYDNLQGVITLRIYTPESRKKKDFISRWRKLMNEEVSGKNSTGINTYALYAYDTVWLLARAIDAFFEEGGKLSFSPYPGLSDISKGSLNLNAMSIFNEGNLLLDSILQVNMTGVTGMYSFGSDRNLVRPAFEVINVIGTGMRRVGFWTNYSGLSVLPPESVYSKPANRSTLNQHLYGVVWPGQTAVKPRGWVFPQNGGHLRIGVPRRVSFGEFVGQVPHTDDMFKGYCIDVFIAAVNLLPYGVPYKLIGYGDGLTNPSNTELVRMITTGVFDAAVGDIVITRNRTKIADFTQPYIESGLVVVVPVTKSNSRFWSFLRPLTPQMWGVTAAFFLVIGAVVWILEHRQNDEFRGRPRKQFITTLWFSFSTLFFAHRENTVSTLGRFVVFLWLFVVLIINSSYTANLTSILTVQQLSSSIKGIESLMHSTDRIGYQHGSFAHDYLVDELGIHESRLVPLNLPEDFARALKDGPRNGGVAAVIDQRAYMELFLSTHCEFSIVGQEFTKNGWGFAFPRDSPLSIDMSTAILKLSESGELQQIHDKWLKRSACSSETTKLVVDRLQLGSFLGLFFICGVACLLALLIHFCLLARQFARHYSEPDTESLPTASKSGRLQTFLSFFDEKEEAIKARSKRRRLEGNSNISSTTFDGKSINGSTTFDDASVTNSKRYRTEQSSKRSESL